MRHPIIEQNKRFLFWSYQAARVFGLLFLSFGVLLILSLLTFLGYDMEKLSAQAAWKGYLDSYLFIGINYVFYSLIAFGIGELLLYLLNSQYKPGWTLLYADRILYVYAVFLIFKNGYALTMKHNFSIMGIIVAAWLGYAVGRILLPIIKKEIASMPQPLFDNTIPRKEPQNGKQ